MTVMDFQNQKGQFHVVPLLSARRLHPTPFSRTAMADLLTFALPKSSSWSLLNVQDLIPTFIVVPTRSWEGQRWALRTVGTSDNGWSGELACVRISNAKLNVTLDRSQNHPMLILRNLRLPNTIELKNSWIFLEWVGALSRKGMDDTRKKNRRTTANIEEIWSNSPNIAILKKKWCINP